MPRKFIIDPVVHQEDNNDKIQKFYTIIEIYEIKENSDWIDKGTYYLNINEQRTPGWFRARLFRVTTSEFGTPLQLNDYCSDDDYAYYITNMKKKVFLRSEMDRMNNGTIREPIARSLFCILKSTKEKIYRVDEIGLAVPKTNLRVGGSTDGVVYINGVKTKSNIEIKCPEKMYKELIDNLILINLNLKTSIYYENVNCDQFIKPMHYCQMQGCMYILNATRCYYIVYEKQRNLLCVCVVKRNDVYITSMMSGIDRFIDTKVIPLIKSNWLL